MAKVDRKDFDTDLQSYYSIGKAFTFLLTRIWGIKLANVLLNFITDKKLKNVQKEKRLIKSKSGGPDIPVFIYKPTNCTNEPLPVLLYIHGGGYIIGTPENNTAY